LDLRRLSTLLIGPPYALANWGSSSWKGPLAVWGAIYAIYRVYIRNCFPPKSCAAPPEGSSSWKIHLAKGLFRVVQLQRVLFLVKVQKKVLILLGAKKVLLLFVGG
jgi:hypothetical protein